MTRQLGSGKLVIATHNAGKLREISALLTPHGMECISAGALGLPEPAETGTTFVFVTHDQSEALALSNRVAIFDHGKLQQLASPKTVYERPTNRFVAEFLGEINILPLSNVRRNGSAILGDFEGQALHADAGGTLSETLAIRPEYMALHLARPAEGNAIAAQLRDLTYLGAETQLALVTAGGVGINLSLPTAALPQGVATGQEVWAAWPEERAFFL